jgi:hypothetical protein
MDLEIENLTIIICVVSIIGYAYNRKAYAWALNSLAWNRRKHHLIASIDFGTRQGISFLPTERHPVANLLQEHPELSTRKTDYSQEFVEQGIDVRL